MIAERIAAWQEIARRLAHEIKNPLTPIQMAMDTLRKTWKKQHPSFDEILEESTTTVLAGGRSPEAHRRRVLRLRADAEARVPRASISTSRAIARSRSIKARVPVEIKLDADGCPQLDADKNQLNQVLLNLVENARDAIGSARRRPASPCRPSSAMRAIARC